MLRLIGFAVLVVSFTVFLPPDAKACGMFTRPSAESTEDTLKTPYLSVERTLLVWDRETKEEDFVREARFERAAQGFGFVVPTPTKPEVFAVKDPPFDRLQQRMPYVPYKAPPPMKHVPGLGGGGASAAKPDAEPVEVLAQQKIGSFTAFTLQASEAGAFDEWLGDNGFVIPTEARSWLEHYVRLKFFFVAFKYDAPASATKSMTSETVRIRFKTPKPYYPYMDATHPKGMDLLRPRTLLGWTITRDRMIDVARCTKDAGPGKAVGWRRPWSYSWQPEVTPEDVALALGPDLAAIVPRAPKLWVQPFRDLKSSREGYGDVVLVNLFNDETFTRADEDAHRVLLGVLDPALAGGEGDVLQRMKYTRRQLDEAADEEQKKRSASCATAPGAAGGGGWVFALAAIALLRRRGFVLALGLLGCRRTEATDAGAPAASSAAEPFDAEALMRPYTTAEREERVFDVLRGKDPGYVLEDPDARPTPTVDLSFEAKPGGFVPPDSGARDLTRDRALRRCYLDARRSAPTLDVATVVLHLVVDAEGYISTADGVSADAGAVDLPSCVLRSVRQRRQVVEIARETNVTLQITFRAGPPDEDGSTRE
ncbi:MAG: DUF2330 domain-containing protein [Labilithrix sp.]|nr:DUF2330 domain-containing protein [Labilithrix sp.]MCW5813154.1 DUF2330 domain-containing protein [Labilithrix sp.]